MLSAAVFAAEDITLNAGKDLLVYTAGGDNGKIAAALNIDSEELSSYISENNVEYFAVNKENTVQIKLTVNITEFSSSVSNLSNLSDGNIESLLPEITGIDGIRGEVLDKNGQKFAKIQLSSLPPMKALIMPIRLFLRLTAPILTATKQKKAITAILF